MAGNVKIALPEKIALLLNPHVDVWLLCLPVHVELAVRSYLELTMQQAPSENGDICGLFNEELLLRIPFEHVSDQIRIDLAILLDPPSMRGNWRMLAHHLDFEPTYIRWIESRKAVLGSNTLTLLQDLCEQRCGSGANSVGLMMRVLKKMGRDDVLGMLRQRKHLQEIEDTYKKACRLEESRQSARPNYCINNLQGRGCPEPMDVRVSFVSNPAHVSDDVGANITLNHSCNESSATKGNDGDAQTDWLCDKCSRSSGVTSPSGHNSTKPERYLCCAKQCAEQNRNNDHAACSLQHRSRPVCDPTPSYRSVPHAHDGHRAHRCSNLRCTALDSPGRAQTYPRYRCEQHSEQRSATSTMSHWTSASARMQTGPYHEATRPADIFVTYAKDATRGAKIHMKRVMKLCDCLKENKFRFRLDESAEHFNPGQKHPWVTNALAGADFILMCISQLYLDDIRRAFKPPSAPSLSTALIYHHMEAEFQRGLCNRAIPLLFPGVTRDQLPPWMQRLPAVYHWPGDYEDMFFLMTKPEAVVNEFVTDRQAASLNGGAKNPVVALQHASLS